jgi:hypothetical protein
MRRRLALKVAAVAMTLLVAGPCYASTMRSGDIIVLTQAGTIIRVDPLNGSQSVVASGGFLSGADGIAVNAAGEIFVVAAGDTVVRVAPSTGDQMIVSAGGVLRDSRDITIAANGDLLLPSVRRCCPVQEANVVRVDPATGVQSNVLLEGPGLRLIGPVGIEMTPSGTMVLILDLVLGGSFGGVALIDPMTGGGNFRLILSGGPYIWPSDFAVTAAGNILVNYYNVNTQRRDVLVFDSDGAFLGVLATRHFRLIHVDNDDHLLGLSQEPDESGAIYRVNTLTGEETFLTSVAAPVADITVTPPVVVAADAFVRNLAPTTNEGANPRLRIQGLGRNRPLVDFDLSQLDRTLVARATLVLTIADPVEHWGPLGVRTVQAHPLRTSFAEGTGKNAGLPDAEAIRGAGPGVTWTCASDSDIGNQRPDCRPFWRGGDFGPATARPVIHADGQTGEVRWDVTKDVLAGTSGWLLRKTEELLPGQVTYFSKEGAQELANPALAPRLLLEWR